MNVCRTCKHWKRPSVSDGSTSRLMCSPVDPDTFQPMDRGFEARLCKEPTQGFFEPPAEADRFSIADGSTYLATLVTGEAFGCVRHAVAGGAE